MSLPRETAAAPRARPSRQRLLDAEARALRDAHAAEAGVERPADFPVVLIPTFGAPPTRLPKQRRRTFRAHLERLAATAVAQRDAELAALPEAAPPTPAPVVEAPAPTPELAAVQGTACARCGGYCCREGGDHAYLTVDLMRRRLDEDPSATAATLVDAYLRHVGAVTLRRSCIYHGPRGCTLPRALRSDTCNQYFCAGLAALSSASGAPARAFLAQIADDAEGAVRSGAFVDARDVRVVRRR